MKRSFLTLFLLFSGFASKAFAADAAQLYVLGNQAYGQRDLARALELYKASAQANPASGHAYWGQANCYLGLGRREEALRAYQTAARYLPAQPQIQARIQQLQTPPVSASAPLPAPVRASPPPNEGSWFAPLWRSALVPGWGQAYNGQSTKAWLLGAVTWASFGGVLGTYMMGTQAMDEYSQAKTASDALNAYDRAYSLYTANQTFYIVFGFAYVYNIFDAALNVGAGQHAALPGDVKLALLPQGPCLVKEWTW